MTRFSIVIPVFNASKTIVETINSCLNQSFSDFEIIVVDDYSVDESIKVLTGAVSDERLRIFRSDKNKGVSSTRNIGWENATGEYVAFLDSDDIWHTEKLSLINSYLKENKTDVLGHRYTDDFGLFSMRPEVVNATELKFWNILFRNYFNTSCLVVKRNIPFRFNEVMRYTEDHELLIRLSNRYQVMMLDCYLTLLSRPQLSVGGLSGNKWKMRKGEMKMYVSAAKTKKTVYALLPFLMIYSSFKHLIKIFR
ncbi:putative glycosyltransferase O-antigen related protein [Pedobacter sp. BAL39]|uniref:glycosyltransferase family 2 protein n=1 Tax=Pedobacter sp. BAL39 TaxID=391596 RepID=UPI000155970C|nr:glycosyltransferase family 2 protein [Pedobacter sp. BAL39]EDM37180.1 putative glycosyltransferase O-antigen related protein [Pedobacter sp. BAL39]